MAKSRKRPPMRRDGDGHRHSYSYKYSYGYGYGYAGYQKEKRPRKLNVVLLTTTVLLLATAIPATYFWHDYQTKKLSQSLWDYGRELADQERWNEASAAMYRVWDIKQDPVLLGEAVVVYDKAAAKRDPEGVIAAYQKAIGGLPDRIDLRKRLAELLTRNQQFESAFLQSQKVLDKEPDSLEGKKWRALSLLGLNRTKQSRDGFDVLEELKQAFIEQQHDFDIASALISHIRQDLSAQNGSELAAQADGVMNRLVAANPKDVNARLARYQYRSRYKLAGAKRDIEQAVILAPENPTVIKQAAWSTLRDAVSTWKASDYLAARELFKSLIKINPKDEHGYLGLGDTEYLVQGNIANAIDVWEQGREKSGDSLPLLLRIAEGQANSFEFDKVEKTLEEVDLFLASLPASSAERNRNWAQASAALFRSKLLLEKKKPLEAIEQLKVAANLGKEVAGGQSGPQRLTNQSTAYSALISLGKTYAELGRFKDAASSYERALLINPDSEIALLQGAAAWAEVGELDRAIRNIEKAERLNEPSVEVSRAHAQYLLEKELATPTGERDWQDFRDTLQGVRSKLADSWELRLLEADYAIHRERVDSNDYSEVMGKLLSIEQDFPNELEIWQRLPFIYESLDMRSDSDRALNRLEQLTTSSAKTKLLIVDLLLGRNQPDEAQKVLDGLRQTQLDSMDIAARERAQLRITEYRGNDREIDDALLKYCKQYPQDSLPIERLLDRRLCGVSQTQAPSNEDLVEDLKLRQQQTESTWQYYAARLELLKPSPNLSKLQKYQASLTTQLPYWSRTHEMAGRVARLENNTRDARLAFNSALAKPSPNPELIRLLMDENLGRGDYLANIRILEKHRQMPSLARIASNGQWTRLQRELDFSFVDRGLTNSSVEASPMWDELLGKRKESGGTLADLVTDLWLTNDEQATEQSELVSQIQSKDLGENEIQAFILGQVYQLAGRFEDAKKQFGQVSDSDQRLRAEVYSHTATNQILMERARKIKLVEARAGSTKRLEAVVKLRRATSDDLIAARDLLKPLVDGYEEDSDRLLLAMCLEQLKQYDEAQEQLEAVVESEPTARHVATLIDFLLKQGKNEQAQVWLDQLEGQTGWEKKTVMLRSRWMAATNRHDEIEPFVEMFATERFRRAPQSTADEMRDVAAIYKAVNMVDHAERWLNMLASRFPNQSEDLSLLLVEKDETDRAVQRCISQLQKEKNVETATLLARILVYGNVSSSTQSEILPLLEECRKQYPTNASLLFALGNLQIKLDQTNTAIETLAEVTKLQPGHYLAWNNLAALLAEQEGRESEAMDTINTAIDQAAYEIPTLMDTKAVVLLHQDRFAAAATLLRDKVTRTRAGTDPRFFFHLAISLDGIEETEAAREALREAEHLELNKSFLTKFEKAELGRLTEKLAENK